MILCESPAMAEFIEGLPDDCEQEWKVPINKKENRTCSDDSHAEFGFFDRGARNRTRLWSFGDSYSTDELHPYRNAAFASD